jgi:hypothetical protein
MELLQSLHDVAPIHLLAARNEHVIDLLPILKTAVPVHLADNDISQLADECRKLAPAGVVTFSERCVLATARLAAALGLPHNSARAAGFLTDKNAQRERLQAAGVGGVKFAALDTPADWNGAVARTGLPLVIKPRVGEGSRNTFLVTDPDEGYNLASELLQGPESSHGVVVEEFLQGRDMSPFGDQVSVESMAQDGVISHLAVTGKFPMVPPFREFGQFWPSTLEPAEEAEITSLVTSALRAVEFTCGLSHTEVKLTPSGPRIIEVNGRIGGYVNDLARRSSGFDLIELAGNIAVGNRIRPLMTRPASVFFQFSNVVPEGAQELLAIRGRQWIRGIPGVDAYHVLGHLPQVLEPGVHSQELDLICGHVTAHDEMFSVISEVFDALTFSFRFGAEVADAVPARPSLPADASRRGRG